MSISNIKVSEHGMFSCLSRQFSCLTPLQARVLSLGLLAVGLFAMALIGYCYRSHKNPINGSQNPPPNTPLLPQPGVEERNYSDGRKGIGTFGGGFLTKGTMEYPPGHKDGIQSTSGAYDTAGRLHGKGCRLEYSNGIVLEGKFDHGRLVRGSKTYPENCRDDAGNVIPYKKITGEFIQRLNYRGVLEDLLHGEDCSIELTDGSVCQGRYAEGVFVFGTQTFVNHPTVRSRHGHFKKGELHGDNCTETLVDGTVHQGKFARGGLTNGSITYLEGNGDVRRREGEFYLNQLSGHGYVEFFNRNKHSGRFNENKLTEGTKEYHVGAFGDKRKEQGTFSQPEVGRSLLSGKACSVFFFGGDTWEGKMENDELVEGVKTFTRGNGRDKDVVKEEGTFINRILRTGTVAYASGKIVSGTFDVAGNPDGLMTITEHGKTYKGNYQSGYLQGDLEEVKNSEHSSSFAQQLSATHPSQVVGSIAFKPESEST